MKKLKVLLVVLMLFGAAGCSKEEVKPQREQTNQIVESRGVVDDFSDKLILNGKTISLPTTLEELGDDYEFNKNTFIDYINEGIRCTQGELNYRGKKFAIVVLLNDEKKKMNEDSIVYSFKTQSYTPQEEFVLGNLKKGSTRDEVIKLLGDPEKEGATGVMQYFNSKAKSANERILVNYDENKKIESITIGRYPDGWK